MPLAGLAAGYLGLCIVVALLGMNRKLGGWGYFFASVLLTPIIGFLLMLASDRRPRLAETHARQIAALQGELQRLKAGSPRPPAAGR